ncbi:tRNA lysidine(34) synthetase TilS [uncultured Sphingomonas sp.]|uniref:tRNA lysidine(34) synthetase TilS n=1 Tax=uncultured Sphingomonas sp. TaxID=158754 RepID=UPI0025DDF564|nr:tRNA lysidine(34) synthetase TilS [uncultured Sphingomonas sp.]
MIVRAPLPERVARFAADLDRIAPGGQLAVAVSGGPDSLALLLLASAARPGRVVAATVDHGLRPESAGEAAMVADLCRALSIPHHVSRITVEARGEGIQAAARTARYAALTRWARDEAADWLATAHHLDDQAETMLMRLARGSGVTGLSGIRPSRRLGRDLSLVRPLLGWRKAELVQVAAAAAAGLTPVDDPSNRDPRFDRTRARALLTQGWPTPERLAAVATRLGEAEAALHWQTERLARARLTVGDGRGRLDPSDLPRELRRRLLLMALARMTHGADPRGDDVDRLLDRLDAGDTSTLAGIRIEAGPVWRLSVAPPRRSG